MATAYAEFRCLGSDLLAQLQAAILASSDWSRPNAGARPNTLKATTTRGAQMVVDLSDVAPTVQKLTLGVYDSYDGTTLGNKLTRYLWMKNANTGTLAANYYYVTVSAGKEHLFFSVEGPRSGDTSNDLAGIGSNKQYFFLCDLVPYYDNTVDPNPAVICGASDTTNTSETVLSTTDMKVWATKSKSGQPWSAGMLAMLDQSSLYINLNRTAADGNYVMSPFVFFDDVDGMRGRLNNIYYMGFNYTQVSDGQPSAPQGGTITKDSVTYKIINANKGGVVVNAGPLGYITNDTAATATRSVLVAIPTN